MTVSEKTALAPNSKAMQPVTSLASAFKARSFWRRLEGAQVKAKPINSRSKNEHKLVENVSVNVIVFETSTLLEADEH